MSIATLLRDPSIDNLLALGLFDALMLLVTIAACVVASLKLFFYIRRQPVYISPTPWQPFWRRRITHGVGACSILALVVIAFL